MRGVQWYDWDLAVAHTRSRALLMREFLRRAAHWAKAYGAEEQWPFYDVTELIAPGFRAAEDVENALEDFLDRSVGTPSTARTCRGAVRWAALRTEHPGALPDRDREEREGQDQAQALDLYEPLLLLYERGGGYSVGEFIDLYGVMIPYGDLPFHLTAEPFLTLAPGTLDALDQGAVGRITYYAKIGAGHPRSAPRGILRRRVVGRDGGVHDEAFTRNLRWEPTEYLRRYELGHDDVDHVVISEREAAAFIERVAGAAATPPSSQAG
nr:hypothetical protein [Streptomyces mexicanus]